MRFLKQNYVRICLLLIGAVFLAIGVWQGEVEQVYRKAVTICMECIGLG